MSEISDILDKKKDNLANSKEGIVARYADELYMFQPIVGIGFIEKQRTGNRNNKQEHSEQSFASLFQKTREKHEVAKKHTSNGFDVLC